ncbi:MAG: hypothetical protein GY865_09010 [candidate division Zixibacteria bacterium]|nr:hypothetical protein [candidate division Zixibacteria bacterium]
MKKYLLPIGTLLISAIVVLGGYASGSEKNTATSSNYSDSETNTIAEGRMLLVLAAPSESEFELDEAKIYNNIVDFQVNYALQVIEAGHDNIIVLVDDATKSKYGQLPDDVLLSVADGGLHIWSRDYTTVNPYDPVEFTYTWSTMSKDESKAVQTRFNEFLAEHNIIRKTSDYRLDGGNIVDNYEGGIITTTRFVTDNTMDVSTAKDYLKNLLGATKVAILEPDEEVMAHSDGMVMWLDGKNLLINDYESVEDFGADYQQYIMKEVTSSFPNANIIKVPVQFSDDPNNESSACGINLNSVMTKNALYVPVFGGVYTNNEKKVLSAIESNTTKPIVEVEANGVCDLGGSVRCLTWQLTGDNAEKLIMAARED